MNLEERGYQTQSDIQGDVLPFRQRLRLFRDRIQPRTIVTQKMAPR